MTKSLHEWLSHLELLHLKTIALGLERVAEVKQRLQLDTKFSIIVVGGTNGKGSVRAMLHAAGYRVACYTSPHLLSYNERVRIARNRVGWARCCAHAVPTNNVASNPYAMHCGLHGNINS